MLPVAIVHHGNCAPLPVFDARHFLLVKEAGLVSVQFAAHTGNGSKCLVTHFELSDESLTCRQILHLVLSRWGLQPA